MDVNALPFNVSAMSDSIRPWIECESPIHDAATVDRMIDLANF